MSKPDLMVTEPLVGAFYWIPAKEPTGRIVWWLVTCHDFHRWDGISHRELWPSVLGHLALCWGKDPAVLRRRLGDHYYALPRGRVTHPSGGYLILHGNDAPSGTDWRNLIIDRFHLAGQKIESPWDEHETTLHEDVSAFNRIFNVDLR